MTAFPKIAADRASKPIDQDDVIMWYVSVKELTKVDVFSTEHDWRDRRPLPTGHKYDVWQWN